MSYQPARYANPILEEMERLFGLDENLRRLASGVRQFSPAKPKERRHG